MVALLAALVASTAAMVVVTYLVKRRSAPETFALVGLPLATVPAQVGLFFATREFINGFRELALAGTGGAPPVLAAIARSSDIAASTMLASVLVLLLVLILALSLSRSHGNAEARGVSGIRVFVLFAGAVVSFIGLSFFEPIGYRATLVSLVIVVPMDSEAVDDSLPRIAAATANLEIEDDISAVSNDISVMVTAAAFGAFGMIGFGISWFVISVLVSSGGFPRLASQVGLVLVALTSLTAGAYGYRRYALSEEATELRSRLLETSAEESPQP